MNHIGGNVIIQKHVIDAGIATSFSVSFGVDGVILEHIASFQFI